MNTILFDLDGTLLPMDQDEFIEGYLKSLVRFFTLRGCDAKSFSKGLNAGVIAAATHASAGTNEQAFWKAMATQVGEEILEKAKDFDEYYETDYLQLHTFIHDQGLSRQIVDEAKRKGYRLILATNPVFPMVATATRMGWAGLQPEDFLDVTSFENSTRCKPDGSYYEELLGKWKLRPQDCLMVGNDIRDDMLAPQAMGMETWLVTDYLIPREGHDVADYRHGSLQELLEFVRQLPDVNK